MGAHRQPDAGHPDEDHGEPEGHELGAAAQRLAAARRRDQHAADGERRGGQAGLPRGVAQPELQVLGEDEEHRDEPGEVEEAHRGAEHVGVDPEKGAAGSGR
jgi:hypothetical protein